MATLIRDPEVELRLRSERAATGADRYDEIWEGIYMMALMPNDEHQQIVSRFVSILEEIIGWPSKGNVRPGVNVSDRADDWQQNYRVPDVAVFLAGGMAVNHGAFWQGGPDFVVEVISPDDNSREKIPFYSRVGVRELLLVDRQPWRLELYRLQGDRLNREATVQPDHEQTVSSNVVPLTFGLISQSDRPHIEVAHAASDRVWMV
ncbi:MAG: Uma2 family endonuclease [Planctomycetota bacterium]|nr:Uma2 family endonuclease [Planctomycetota bacterium]